ncbi:hypothetical protein ACFLU6_09190 [Acidobacteriota bacterium]
MIHKNLRKITIIILYIKIIQQAASLHHLEVLTHLPYQPLAMNRAGTDNNLKARYEDSMHACRTSFLDKYTRADAGGFL